MQSHDRVTRLVTEDTLSQSHRQGVGAEIKDQILRLSHRLYCERDSELSKHAIGVALACRWYLPDFTRIVVPLEVPDGKDDG